MTADNAATIMKKTRVHGVHTGKSVATTVTKQTTGSIFGGSKSLEGNLNIGLHQHQLPYVQQHLASANGKSEMYKWDCVDRTQVKLFVDAAKLGFSSIYSR